MVLLSVPVSAEEVSLRHQSPGYWAPETELRIQASTPRSNQIEEMLLFYRRIGQSDYVRKEMHANDSQNYVGIIPDTARAGDGIEYYIEAISRTGQRKTVPDFFATITPIQIKLREDLESDRAKLVWPTFEEPLADSQPLFEFEFYDSAPALSPETIEIELDGKSLTAYATVSGFGATVKSPFPLMEGGHTIKLIEQIGNSRTTVVAREFQYGSVKPPRQSQIHGTLQGQYSRLKSTQTASSFVAESDDQVNLTLSGTHSGLEINGNVMISSREQAQYQPLNRYMFSVNNQDRSLQINFGDTNPDFSELTVSGILSRGMNLAYAGGWGDVKVNFGDTLRSVEGSTSENVSGTFQQNIAAFQSTFKLGNWGTISPTVAKISDNEASILDPGGAQPHENYLSSLKSTIWLNDREVEIGAEIGASLFYRDKTAEIAEVPGIPSIVKSTFPIKAGMTFDTATKFSIDAPIANSLFSAYFSRTGSGYQSLGNTGLRSDRQEYYLSDKVYFFSKSAYISGSYKKSHNNLLGLSAITESAVGYKLASGINFPGWPNLSGALGIDQNSNNATQDRQSVNNQILSVSGSLSNLGLSLWSFTNQFSVNGSYSLFTDRSAAKLLPEYNQKSLSANWRNQFVGEIVTILTGGVSIKTESATALTTTYYNASVDVSDEWRWLRSAVVGRFSVVRGHNSAGTLNVWKFQPELTVTWDKDATTRFTARGRYLDFRDSLDAANSYKENNYSLEGRINF